MRRREDVLRSPVRGDLYHPARTAGLRITLDHDEPRSRQRVLDGKTCLDHALVLAAQRLHTILPPVC